MQNKLVILFHADCLERPSWFFIDSDSEEIKSVWRGDPVELADLSKNREVWAMVPSEDVSLMAATLPKMNHAKRLKALPFVLEDQLAEKIETLHFAMGQANGDNLFAAVLARQKIESWLELLKSWQVQVDVMIPHVLGLPCEENKWTILLWDQMAFIRRDLFHAYVIDRNNLSTFLNLSLQTLNKPLDGALIYNLGDSVQLDLAGLDHQSFLIDEKKLLYLFEKTLSMNPIINLLQGPYALKKSKTQMQRKFSRLTPFLLGAWVLLLIAYPSVSYMILSGQAKILDQKILTIYFQQFPNASALVAPKKRMRDKLKKLKLAQETSPILKMLGSFGEELVSDDKIKLNRFDFRGKQLTVELTAESSVAFDRLIALLKEKGLHVKQQNTNVAGGSINTTLLIESLS